MKIKIATIIMLLVCLTVVFSQQILPVFAQPEGHTVSWLGDLQTNNQRALTRSADGTLHCVYGRGGHIRYSYSLDDGETWVEEQASVSGDPYTCAMALDSADNIHVVWYDVTLGPLQYRMRTSAGVWGSQEGIPNTDTTQKCPSIAIDSGDNVHIAWFANENEIRYSVKTTSGWQSVPDTISEGPSNYQLCPSIAIDSGDNVHIAWVGTGSGVNSGVYNIYYKMKPNGGAWGSLEFITDEPVIQGKAPVAYTGPSIAIDSNDDIHVIWTGLGWGTYSSHYNIQYRKRTSGIWESVEAVTDIDENQNYFNIALDTEDNAHAVWAGKGWGVDPGNSSIQHAIKTPMGWSSPETLASHSEDDAGHSEYPTLPIVMWAMHPEVSGVRPNIPDSEVSLIYMSVDYDASVGYPNFRIVYLHVDLVEDVEEQIEDLIDTVETMEVPLERILINPLNRALQLLEQDRPSYARYQLNSFIRRCRFYRRIGFLTPAEYTQLVETANEIKAQI
jgi:hypothetical protein